MSENSAEKVPNVLSRIQRVKSNRCQLTCQFVSTQDDCFNTTKIAQQIKDPGCLEVDWFTNSGYISNVKDVNLFRLRNRRSDFLEKRFIEEMYKNSS